MVPLDQAPETQEHPKPQTPKRHSTARRTLIPADCMLDIQTARLNDIYIELKRKLRVDDAPNAAGVLLRVFLELSLDLYIDQHNITLPRQKTLANKVAAVTDFMEKQLIITKDQAIPVREAVKSGDKINLATNLNAIVHNPTMSVSGTDLKALWTRLQTLFEKIWS